MDILDTICRSKRFEIEQKKLRNPIKEILQIIRGLRVKPAMTKEFSLKEALINSNTGIIAEFKRKSPSKGWINRDADVTHIVKSYEAAGAAAISCLTDEAFFGGSFEDFKKAREVIKRIPLLRKDFILDEYQLYQSKALGADVVLLIAACLTAEEIARFTSIAHELDMEVLLEIHEESELLSICPDVDVIGINNRNLKTFVTDIQRSLDLAKLIPDNFIKISESGISNTETVIQLRKAGYSGFLIGESFMRNNDPEEALRGFIDGIACHPAPEAESPEIAVNYHGIADQARNDK